MDEQQIAVSVIVPVYNVEKYLKRCLDSLAKQTLANIEIIVVNDGTKDHSQDIIDQYVNMYPKKFISLIKENGGLSDARNYGLPYANGEYVGFVDSDDYADITLYEKLYSQAKKDDADIVVCGYYGIDEETGTFKQFQKGNKNLFGKSLKEEPSLLYVNSTYAWNKIYRKKMFTATGILYPKGVLFEDMAVTWSLFPHANKISKVDEPLYYYILKREGAITATYSEKMLQMFDSMAIVNQYYKKIGIFEDYYEILGFVNMKHTFIRIKDFTNYRNHSLKKKIIDRGIHHLTEFFPNWRSNAIFFDKVYRNNKAMKLFKHISFWKFYSFLPGELLFIVSDVKKTVKKAKRIWSKRNYITRYLYTSECNKKAIVKKQALFESFQGATMSDSPFYMMLELSKDSSFNIYYAVKNEIFQECKKRLDELHLNIQLVKVYSKEYQHALATSEFLVNNVSFPPYVIRRRGQKYINTWHGTPLKTLGKKMKDGIQDMSNMQRNFLQSTMLLYPNSYTYQHMSEDYLLLSLYTEDILISGYPRNAIFKNENSAKKVKSRFHLTNIEQIAYMPTWRGSTSAALELKKQLDEVRSILKSIDETLSEKQKCFVNLHSLIQDKIDYSVYQHIQPFPKNIDTYQFLNSCDCLITDYSSVFFDYSITKKPIALYVYDLETYNTQRGMYLDLEELPFTILKTEEELKAYLIQNKNIFQTDDKENYEKMFIQYDDINNTNKVNDVFFYGQKENVQSLQHNKSKQFHLYFMPKIKDPEDEKFLKEALNDTMGISVFDRSDFTPITQKLLSSDDYKDFVYIIMDVRMQLTLNEQINKSMRRPLSSKVYKRELQRILPNLNFVKCTDYKKSKYTKGISHVINQEGCD